MGRYGHIGWCRTPSQGDRLIAEEMIARVGMDGYEDRQINELSGGQQQRVSWPGPLRRKRLSTFR